MTGCEDNFSILGNTFLYKGQFSILHSGAVYCPPLQLEWKKWIETLHCVKLVAFYLRNPSLPTLCILKHQTSKYSCWILVPRKKIWFVAKLVNAKTQLKKKNYYGKNIWSTYLINYVHVEFMRMGSLSFCHIRLIFFNYNFLHYRYC